MKRHVKYIFVNFTDGTDFLALPRFRRGLKKGGFMRFDTRTYFRPTTADHIETVMKGVKSIVPLGMTARVFILNDAQWSGMKILIGG